MGDLDISCEKFIDLRVSEMREMTVGHLKEVY
jgi:hypothetical protein